MYVNQKIYSDLKNKGWKPEQPISDSIGNIQLVLSKKSSEFVKSLALTLVTFGLAAWLFRSVKQTLQGKKYVIIARRLNGYPHLNEPFEFYGMGSFQAGVQPKRSDLSKYTQEKVKNRFLAFLERNHLVLGPQTLKEMEERALKIVQDIEQDRSPLSSNLKNLIGLKIHATCQKQLSAKLFSLALRTELLFLIHNKSHELESKISSKQKGFKKDAPHIRLFGANTRAMVVIDPQNDSNRLHLIVKDIKIGEGTYNRAFLALESKAGSVVYRESKSTDHSWISGINYHRALSNIPGIVPLYSVVDLTLPNQLQIKGMVLERCEGSLKQMAPRKMGSNAQPLSFANQKAIMLKLFQTLASIHNQNLAHLDLKPQNILYKNIDGVVEPFICDFDAMEELSEKNNLSGTLVYQPPEALLISRKLYHAEYVKGIDLFGLAWVGFELQYGKFKHVWKAEVYQMCMEIYFNKKAFFNYVEKTYPDFEISKFKKGEEIELYNAVVKQFVLPKVEEDLKKVRSKLEEEITRKANTVKGRYAQLLLDLFNPNYRLRCTAASAATRLSNM